MEQNNQENQTVEIPEIVIETLRSRAKEKAKQAMHAWKQKGAWLTCKTCDYPHAFRIAANKRLVGIDDRGLPIVAHKA